MVKGLVLEGGAMRGLFTAGVIDVLMENGVKFDKAVGVSAGAAFGCNYKSNQPGRVLRYNLKYSSNWRYKSYRSLIFTGDLYGADFCYHELPNELDIFDVEELKRNPLEFYCVCTDVDTGKPYYHKLTDGAYEDLEFVRASASMPLASRVVSVGPGRYLDGGISDSIPLEFMLNQGCDKCLVIRTQPEGYVKHQYKFIGGISFMLRKYPNLVKALRDRHIMYNNELAFINKCKDEGSAYVITPLQTLNISALETNPDEIHRVYNLGREVATSNLDSILKFLN